MDYWPRVSASVSGTLTQEGTLHGIEGVTGSHNVQINPYVLGQNEKTLLDLDPINPYFSSRKFEGTAGGEAKAVLKDSIVFDATVNPDFSDVESDQPQFTVNQRYPVYFPELRPFFLENANYFSTPLTLLYTRNIIRPEYGGRVIRGGNVNYNPVAGGAPSLMNQEDVQALLSVQPLRQISVDNTYLLDRDHSVKDGELVYESQTFRTKINYQFTRAFSARVIVEYDSTLANPLETSLPRTKQVGTEALLTWLPHPGTAIYIGYNNDIQNLDRGLCNRLRGGGCDPGNTTPPRSSNYLNDGRQIFIKASYLLRF